MIIHQIIKRGNKTYDHYNLIKPTIPGDYWRISCWKNYKKLVAAKRLHQVLGEIMFGPVPKDGVRYEIHHIDEDRENNLPCNLIRLTNAQHNKITSTRKGKTYEEMFGDNANEMKKLVTKNCHTEEAKAKWKSTIGSEESKLKRKPLQILKCPHCGKVGKGNGMYTRHFNNCKLNTMLFLE